MKLLPSLLSAAALVALAPAVRATEHSHTGDGPARHPDYPLTTCVVSDDPLYEMGDAVEYVYHQAGKPDRLVLFCCKDCVKDFAKDPATYLKKLDEAAAAKQAAPAPKSTATR